jgi:hydroxymethylpyrimidine pyrophosphatase-like HAD family hydrolase
MNRTLSKAIWAVWEVLSRIGGRGYVVGPELDDALPACRRLWQTGFASTICYWNEAGESPRKVTEAYLAALGALARESLNCYLSVKLPPLGFARDLLTEVLEQARQNDIRVHFDSLEHAVTEKTFSMIADAVLRHPKLGCTLPGRWRRSCQDADRAVEMGLHVRVVKGQWMDPDNPKLDPRAGFLEVIDRLAGRARHVAIATHDAALAREALQRLCNTRTPCELELLYGLPIRPGVRVARAAGVPVRLYIPYGYGWLPYSLEQVRQNPRILWWIIRDLLMGRSFLLDRAFPSLGPQPAGASHKLFSIGRSSPLNHVREANSQSCIRRALVHQARKTSAKAHTKIPEDGSIPVRTHYSVDQEDLPEERFYSLYDWCLDPVLTLGELFQRLHETVAHYESLRAPWQREECRINLYLSACAIACTIDDYLGQRPRNLSRISLRFPHLRYPVALAQRVLNAAHLAQRFPADYRVARWRRKWDCCVDKACDILTQESEPSQEQWKELRATIQSISTRRLPQRVLRLRMQLPSGFRSQDLTHQDVFSLAHRFAGSQVNNQRKVVVIGPRTMGAYFAPLVKAQLSALGWPFVSWFTIRPKRGISLREKQRLRLLKSPDVLVVVVDESPNTGNTFLLMLNLLRGFGVQPARIVFLAALHPTRPNWHLPRDLKQAEGVTLIALKPEELHKARLLEPRSIQPLLREYLSGCGATTVHINESREIDALNSRLSEHFQDGFQCRLKRVFEVRLSGDSQIPVVRYILAKSVGWGWLGYHSYLAGTRLTGFVPKVIGLRNGLLYTEWLGGVNRPMENMADRPSLQRLSAYVAARARRLPLPEDPCFESSLSYGWTGWCVLIDTLRRAYGPYVGRLKVPALHRELRRYLTPLPALIDGQMRPDEWIRTERGFLKCDFEHHNFGRTELCLADTAYDLASAIFEFQLSKQEEEELLRDYERETGDSGISDRILLHKLLHGSVVMEQAARGILLDMRDRKREDWHRRYLAARNFLVHQMACFCAAQLPKSRPVQWSKRLFFLDLDGVFDSEVFGFPQTTISGLTALALLHSHRFSAVLNTARGVEDVRQYCQSYHLPGGIAELGSVFLDAVRQREVPLIEAQTADQLLRCQEALRGIPGVFIDLNYRYSLRAYRYAGTRTQGLAASEVEDLLTRHRLDRLTFVCTTGDTIIIQKGTNKGRALLAVKEYLGCPDQAVVAIGDNDPDLEMLQAVECAYAPANSSRSIRELGMKGQCRIMSQPFQRGLLAAVREVVHNGSAFCDEDRLIPACSKNKGLTQVLLYAADRPRILQLLSVLKPGSLY